MFWHAVFALAFLAVSANTAHADIVIHVTERQEIQSLSGLPLQFPMCAVRGTITNGGTMDVHRLFFDLVSMPGDRYLVSWGQSDLLVGERAEFETHFDAECAGLADKLELEIDLCRLVGGAECAQSVSLRQ